MGETIHEQIDELWESAGVDVDNVRETLDELLNDTLIETIELLHMTPRQRRIKELRENHAHRHDHTDVTGRCKDCGGFLPENRERVMCANCGRPNRQYVSND